MDHNSRFKSPRQSSPSVDQTIPKAPDQFFSLDSSFFATATPITSTTPQQKGEPPTTIMTATTYNNHQQHPGTFIDIVKTETRLVSESKTALGSVSSTPMVKELDFVSITAATLDSAPPRLPAAVSKPPAQSPWNPDIKVCGFHMHALEWHKMQKLGKRDQITLTERARCPIFNLSVTRWLRNGANHLQKEPFNTVECLCGDPMVVALELSPEDQGGYDLVCPKMLPNFNDLSDTNEYSSNPQMKSSGQQECRNTENYEGPKSRIDQNKSHDRFLPCPKVIKMSKVMYSPRMERVHSSIPNDEWLDRCYWPRPTRRSYYASPRKLPGNITSIISHHMNYYPVDYSKFRESKATQDMAKASVKVRVKEKPDRILPKQTSPSSKNTNGGDDTDEWLRGWFKQSILMSDAILNGGSEGYFDLWSPDKVHDLDKWNVHEVPKELIDFSVKEALKDAKKYADRYERKVVGRLEAQKAREGEIEGELMRAWNQRAEWAKEINMMDKNMGEMTHKCRICYERVLTHAVLPCYHLVMCGSCASMVNECIVCRVKKTGLQRIYWG
ncbi:hypothetical protein BGZ46_001152 [Entomortierella lignicola]|nr:hypothetical protein BGZ46_001152 [Entomortierella lignicola]